MLLYVLLEHQSSADPRMPLRILVYVVRIWERWLREHEDETLPAIVPVVVGHTGSGWTAPTRMHELLDPSLAAVPGLARLVPAFEIVVDDLARASNFTPVQFGASEPSALATGACSRSTDAA